MAETKSLIKDSAIYGGTTILVRMINWLMTFLLTRALTPADFGLMSNLYAYAALAIVLLTFGMETGFFRFASQKDKYNPKTVFSTVLIIVTAIILVAFVVFQVFLPDIRPYIWEDNAPEIYIRFVIIILCLDSFSAIPFAYLRYQKKAKKFGSLKLLFVILYAGFCIFFLVICPWINKYQPQLISWFWIEDFELGYVFVSNLIATTIENLCLVPDLTGFKYKFDKSLAVKLLRYCFPLVLMGVAGISNQVFDKIIFPFIYGDSSMAFDELGIYSACFKIALIMIMFTQAFRYAYEPFIFEKSKDTDAKQSYADVMKYFVIFGLLIFLGVVFYLDIIKYFIDEEYFGALGIVPVALLGELFFAIYANLSLWYKLNDKTHWGAVFSILACIIIVLINVIFIPVYGYWACAWAVFVGNGFIMLLSYFIGQREYPVKYDLKTIGIYSCLAMVLYAISYFVPIENEWAHMGFNTLLIAVYILFLLKRDLPLKEIPYLNRFINKQ
ncbi:MAG: oligosaccharide flippase family protein [Bacteroidales bacterium]|nr:oligosaccharide flippase family protein [Bacteroidales bacterium]